MHRYRRSRAEINVILRKIADGTVTPDDILDLAYDGTDIEVGAPPPKRGESALHNLNGVLLTRFVAGRGAGTMIVYEISWRGEYSAGSSVEEVMRRARARVPKIVHRVGEIIALRGWHLLGDCLRPLTGRDSLTDGPIVTSDLEPTLENTSGLYSIKTTPGNLGKLLHDYQPAAYGFVGLFGTVVEHEDGYRSSKQIIRRLILRLPASKGFVKCLSDRYECDVVIEKRYRT